MSSIVARAKRALPVGAKDAVKRLLGRMPERADVRGVATTVDLYVWLVGGSMDTVVPIHNWYSVFFPGHDTATTARVTLLDEGGLELASHSVDVPPLAMRTLSVAGLLEAHDLAVDGPLRCGSLTWHLRAPDSVRDEVLGDAPRFVFWDRSYIGYRGPADHVAWVHGVDKHRVITEDGSSVPWPLGDGPFTSSPEIPVELAGCETFEVLVQNRDAAERHPTLFVSDAAERTLELHATIPPRGVHRFVVSGACDDLDTQRPLRLRVDDLPTRYGRPIVLRRFAGGAFSLMHC